MAESERKPSLLIVDDERNFRESLDMALNDTFFISSAGSLADAKEYLGTAIPDAVLLDVRLPDGDGVKFLSDLKLCRHKPVVFIMTAYATIESAVRALKEGADEYITKPFDIDKLKRELIVYLQNRVLQKRVDILDKELKNARPSFVTSGTGKMKKIIDMAPMIAALDIPVLIIGDTGTGKERLAKWIYSISSQKGEMVAINCSALPKEIIESELFGYTKGAFSGAVSNKEGLVEKAEGGTLFLDEIGQLPEAVQAKFLRVLEDGVYYKLGDTRERKANFRIISATNSDLTSPDSPFRRDLFYRISGITLNLPPLKDHRDDIPLLVSAFIEEANNSYHKLVKGVSSRVMTNLMTYDWPGNIRELKWMIHRAVVTATGDVLHTLDVAFENEPLLSQPTEGHPENPVPFQEALANLEKTYIRSALDTAEGNKTKAAGILNISLRSLHYKIIKYGL